MSRSLSIHISFHVSINMSTLLRDTSHALKPIYWWYRYVLSCGTGIEKCDGTPVCACEHAREFVHVFMHRCLCMCTFVHVPVHVCARASMHRNVTGFEGQKKIDCEAGKGDPRPGTRACMRA